MDIIQSRHFINDICINIKRISPSISVLYFTNEINNIINIPENTRMYIYGNEKPIILNPYMESYFLCYTDKYQLVINGKVMYMKNQRNWIIE